MGNDELGLSLFGKRVLLSKKVEQSFSLAAEAARLAGHLDVGPIHLFYAVLCDSESQNEKLGIRADRVGALLNSLPDGGQVGSTWLQVHNEPTEKQRHPVAAWCRAAAGAT